MSDRWTEQLSAYLDQELVEELRLEVEAHLVTCEECRDVLAGRCAGRECGAPGTARRSWLLVRLALHAHFAAGRRDCGDPDGGCGCFGVDGAWPRPDSGHPWARNLRRAEPGRPGPLESDRGGVASGRRELLRPGGQRRKPFERRRPRLLRLAL